MAGQQDSLSHPVVIFQDLEYTIGINVAGKSNWFLSL